MTRQRHLRGDDPPPAPGAPPRSSPTGCPWSTSTSASSRRCWAAGCSRGAPGRCASVAATTSGPASLPLDVAVRDRVAELSGHRPAGPIRLLTQLRSFGLCFNPVSFYYCFEAGADGELHSVLAEVTNTPWGERHSYLLLTARRARAVRAGRFAKELHVSPFMGMDHAYQARATQPGPTLSVHIESRREGRLAFDATLAMQRAPADARRRGADDRPLPAGHRPGAGAHLRTRARAQAPRRARPSPPRGGRTVTERESRCRATRWRRCCCNAIRVGSLTIVEGEARRTFGSGPPTATIHVHDPRFWRMLMRGSRGLAESYAQRHVGQRLIWSR